ncbi:MAG TPA: ferric reductase-like transmembrane domain-containing protein [Xanthobacteraceae bacterium]|nr:ferric reductase-like transmembrane domain-containing protein [Xanthobacteraceae bacterium]
MKLVWPWQDRRRRFSPLKAAGFALTLAPAILLAYELRAGELGIYPLWLGELTYWSGVWATVVLLGALAVTPAIRIFGWKSLIDVRRMIGVAALAYTIFHIIVYFALRFWSFSLIAKEMIASASLITATLSTIGLGVLGATSFDAAIRRMGARGWQRLHNWVYVTSLLAILHVLLSRGTNPMQYLLAGMFFWLMGWRLLNRSGRGADPRALALLAVGSGLFAALLEAIWLGAKRGYGPIETLAGNFSLIFGVPPVWQLMALGLLIAVLAALRMSRKSRYRFSEQGLPFS